LRRWNNDNNRTTGAIYLCTSSRARALIISIKNAITITVD
jgi:hypothetical protein